MDDICLMKSDPVWRAVNVAGFQEQPEILELFLTDFQMRLLWGSRGAEENQALRYSKFDQVLTALSNRLEPFVKPRWFHIYFQWLSPALCIVPTWENVGG